jgi:hypothetical protein
LGTKSPCTCAPLRMRLRHWGAVGAPSADSPTWALPLGHSHLGIPTWALSGPSAPRRRTAPAARHYCCRRTNRRSAPSACCGAPAVHGRCNSARKGYSGYSGALRGPQRTPAATAAHAELQHWSARFEKWHHRRQHLRLGACRSSEHCRGAACDGFKLRRARATTVGVQPPATGVRTQRNGRLNVERRLRGRDLCRCAVMLGPDHGRERDRWAMATRNAPSMSILMYSLSSPSTKCACSPPKNVSQLSVGTCTAALRRARTAWHPTAARHALARAAAAGVGMERASEPGERAGGVSYAVALDGHAARFHPHIAEALPVRANRRAAAGLFPTGSSSDERSTRRVRPSGCRHSRPRSTAGLGRFRVWGVWRLGAPSCLLCAWSAARIEQRLDACRCMHACACPFACCVNATSSLAATWA